MTILVSPARAGMDPNALRLVGHTVGFPRTRGDGPEDYAAAGKAWAFPPHARGWTPSPIHADCPSSVSPARAGMDPVTHSCRLSVLGFPRTRGDGPAFRVILDVTPPFPPHARGWTLGDDSGPAACVTAFPPHARGWTAVLILVKRGYRDQVSPARAGMDRYERLTSRGYAYRGFPRTRGDGPTKSSGSEISPAFPPHARGWTGDAGGRLVTSRGFPRTRGDGPSQKESRRIHSAFPPHARGWTLGPRILPTCEPVSPARAGMDPASCFGRRSQLGFPRTRGDGPAHAVMLGDQIRFPPHARGWTRHTRGVTVSLRVSPARAGMDPVIVSPTTAGYRFPRTRGDGPTSSPMPTSSCRFPPHARGWTLDPLTNIGSGKVSPARAGMDRLPTHAPPIPSRFPRTRGDGPGPLGRLVGGHGFPPHARGWTPGTVDPEPTTAVSPARAGMDPGRGG